MPEEDLTPGFRAIILAAASVETLVGHSQLLKSKLLSGCSFTTNFSGIGAVDLDLYTETQRVVIYMEDYIELRTPSLLPPCVKTFQ